MTPLLDRPSGTGGADAGAHRAPPDPLTTHLCTWVRWRGHGQGDGDRERLGILWCNAFAPLLNHPRRPELSYAVLLQIARSRSLPNPGWPSHVAALCRLVHGVFTMDALPLVHNPDLWADLADSPEGAVPSDIANTLVTVPNMPSVLQRLLLCPLRPLTVVLSGAV